jgi:hypothetical protein
LTGRDLDLPTDRMAWLERAIMDIPAEDLLEVSVRHPASDPVELRPGDSEGNTWAMLDAPAEREVKPAWQLRQTAGALAKLNMADVRPHEDGRVPEQAVETSFRTRDGLLFSARSFVDDSGRWVHFRVREAAAAERVPDSSDADTGQSSGVSEGLDANRDPALDVVAVDGRLAPWQFALEEDRFERLRPTMEELLVAPDESGGD